MTVVLHVLEALEGGTARHVTDLVRHVDDITHHVAVPPRRVGGMTDTLAVPAMEAAGATVHRLDMRRMPLSPRNAASLVGLRRLVSRLRPDIVHGHSAIGGALARLAAADSRARRVYTPNGLHPSVIAMNLERGLGALTDRWIAVAPSEAAVAEARGIASRGRMVTIPNGIALRTVDSDTEGGSSADTRRGVDIRHLLGLAGEGPLIGFVGRLVAQKAPEMVIEATALLCRQRPDVKAVMIGSGPREDAVRSLIRERGLTESVHLVPYLPRAATVMDQFDVLLLPSRYEGCPYTVLEAMRAGTPVVLSDAVGNRDLVVDGLTGRLVRQGHPEETAAALVDVVDDPGAARRRAEAAEARLAERHDVRHMAAATAAVYAELA